MRILVTGGTGDIGGPLVDRLVAGGHNVRVIGRRADMEVPGAEYLVCDVCDVSSLASASRGVEAIVHLAAIRSPAGGSPTEIFRVNVEGTFNVYQAAVENEVRRVVTASSINALGYFYGVRTSAISYLPVDEEHSTLTSDVYSYSKGCCESVGAYFARRDGISGTALRIPGLRQGRQRKRTERVRGYLSGLQDPPMPALESKFTRLRELRLFEERGREAREDPRRRATVTDQEFDLFVLVTNLFTDIDVRDCAKAFDLAATREYEGFHPLFVNDTHNIVGVPSAELARLFYPAAAVHTDRMASTESLIDVARAKEIIGFTPDYPVSRLLSEPTA